MPFKQVFLRTLEREGGISDDPVDRGGLTKYGITKPFLSDYLLRPATDADILKLTLGDAEAVYEKQVWRKHKLNLIGNDVLAEFMFDWIINSGPWTVKHLQKEVGTVADGQLGSGTIAAVNKAIANGKPIVKTLTRVRFYYLCRLVRSDPSQVKFLWGWYLRVHSFL